MPIIRIVEEIQQDWSICDIATKRPPLGWEEVFKDALPEFRDLDEILEGQEYFPHKKNLFRAFEMTPLSDVSVVIIGQDPYYQMINIGGKYVPRAQGLSFSVHKEDAIPSSLKNIFKELQATVPDFKMPYHGDLSSWALQGVLLLNTCLTVKPNIARSHGEIWLGFISKVLTAINEKKPGTIFVLWGNDAQSLKDKRSMIDDKAIIITGAHPSGLSAIRYGFFGGDYFNKINRELIAKGKKPINWNLPH